jgi:hypothetical protein
VENSMPNVDTESVYALAQSIGTGLGMALRVIAAHPPTSARNIGRAVADPEEIVAELESKGFPLAAQTVTGMIDGLRTRGGKVPSE